MIMKEKERRVYISEQDIWGYAWQMCMGILHIHTRGIIHRDIKCLNIMLSNGQVKLGDMSESRVLDSSAYIKSKNVVGTPLSLSPEVIKQQGYD